MVNQDMHRADALLTSQQVEQVRNRLNGKVEMLTHKVGQGVPGMSACSIKHDDLMLNMMILY